MSATTTSSTKTTTPTPSKPTTSDSKSSSKPSIFTIPLPLKAIFDTFPLKTYSSNPLPARSQRPNGNILYIWKEPWEIESGSDWRGSCNPGCLKFEAYLHFLGVEFTTVSSNNHASPSGALPFLLTSTPSVTTTSSTPTPASSLTTTFPSSKLREWSLKNSTIDTSSLVCLEKEFDDPLLESRLSLLDHRIRRAWLYTLHLTPLFTSLTAPLYTTTSSSYPSTANSPSVSAFDPSALVASSLATQLLSSATAELQKHTPIICAATILSDASEAFDALETLLVESESSWFSGGPQPGWMDACVFAYTGLLGREDGIWKELGESDLGRLFREKPALVAHRRNIVELYFGA